MARYRDYVFTVNNYSEEDEQQCWALPWEVKDCRYIVVGKEVGESGTPHLQGYISFKEKKSLKQLREFFPTAHFDPRKGTPSQASSYCKKGAQSKQEWEELGVDGPNYGIGADVWEWGELPFDSAGVAGKSSEEARWRDAIQAYGERRFSDIPADILGKCAKGLAAAHTMLRMEGQDLSDTTEKMQWYYGGAGTGKSRKAREENPDAYLKMCNKWWDGYQGEEVVIIEDFDKDHKVLVHHLKIWADRYKFPAEIKGGKIDIRPRKIIVTSNYHPQDIWQDEKDLEPILRRFHITKFGGYQNLLVDNHN